MVSALKSGSSGLGSSPGWGADIGLCSLSTLTVPHSTQVYTAVSTKVVPRKCKSVRDNADWYCG